MHTPIKFFIKTPVDLYRRGGASKPKFDYIRTSPPREAPDKFDLKVKNINGVLIIDHTSGGLSLFDKPNLNSGKDWWVIPVNTALPSNFSLTKDVTNGVFKGHYSIRSNSDINITEWKNTLGSWAERKAIHISRFEGNILKNV